MLVSFVETMRGTVTATADGGRHHIEFEVKAEAPSVREFLKTGMTKVTGLLHAPPWAEEIPVGGTLRISAADRKIEYRLAARGLAIEGTKSVNPLTFLQSMTLMPVTVRDEHGQTLATGAMRFDLRDLAPFLASWLPLPRHAQRLLDVKRRQIERRALAGV